MREFRTVSPSEAAWVLTCPRVHAGAVGEISAEAQDIDAIKSTRRQAAENELGDSRPQLLLCP